MRYQMCGVRKALAGLVGKQNQANMPTPTQLKRPSLGLRHPLLTHPVNHRISQANGDAVNMLWSERVKP
jgi:hypothetical protein